MEFEIHSGFYYCITNRKDWNAGRFVCYLWKDGTLHANTFESNSANKYNYPCGCWKTEQEAQRFLDNWLPSIWDADWLTEENIKRQAKISEESALNCSIEHYKQILLAGYDKFMEARREDLAGIDSDFCAMCQRKNMLYGRHFPCINCLLNKEGDLCHENNEWKKLNVVICERKHEEFDEAVIAVLNRLTEIKNKHYKPNKSQKIEYRCGRKPMVEMTVKQVAERLGVDEVKIVKEKEKKEHIFKAGDVADFKDSKRFIVKVRGVLHSINKYGRVCSGGECIQKEGYEYLGRLNDFNYINISMPTFFGGMNIVQ